MVGQFTATGEPLHALSAPRASTSTLAPVPAPAPAAVPSPTPVVLDVLDTTGAPSGPRLRSAAATHPGLIRQNNEDTLAAHVPAEPALLENKGVLFAIADGVGGQAAGEVASRTATKVLLAEYYSPRAPHRVEAALRQAVQAANLRVCTLAHGGDPALRSMQTTLTALVLAGRQAFLAHAGDARVYLLRGGALTQLTGDHSEAAELLRLRLITPEQARYHPRRNVLTRALGSNLMMRPDFQRLPVELDDRFLLCTDGLWGEITPEALTHAASGDPELACRRLITLALDAGGGDNVSLHVVHVLDPGPPAGAPPSRIGRLLAGLRGGG